MRFGFIGLGAMGRGMAGALLAEGHEVAGFDVNPAAALQVFLGASGADFGKHDDNRATRFYERLGGKKVRRDG